MRDATASWSWRSSPSGAGKVATRAFLGDDAAAELYEAFLLDTLAVCRAVDATALVSYAPDDDEARAYFAGVAPGVIVAPQRDVPFGTGFQMR